ncbi:hypothetical protein BDV34DRAFT_3354 [Aspergillus parasiticus]|uniref:Uncharacterized protein n=1 Tax=Aspergillus parasiticus TaxID=5067 RepID=A0A5N6E4S8_ASPPA|nr:hypothetical protein BDV34DRAFT_3354 [Aspergillus parasiticus]
MSGLAKSRKKKGILAGGAKSTTHSYLDNNNHGRISFSVCAVLHQIHSGQGAVLIPILSLPDLHLYILVSLFSPGPSQPCSTAHSSRIRKRASIGWFPNASMAAEKSFGQDQADIRSIRTTTPLRAHSIHARLHGHLHVDQTDYSRR